MCTWVRACVYVCTLAHAWRPHSSTTAFLRCLWSETPDGSTCACVHANTHWLLSMPLGYCWHVGCCQMLLKLLGRRQTCSRFDDVIGGRLDNAMWQVEQLQHHHHHGPHIRGLQLKRALPLLDGTSHWPTHVHPLSLRVHSTPWCSSCAHVHPCNQGMAVRARAALLRQARWAPYGRTASLQRQPCKAVPHHDVCIPRIKHRGKWAG